MIVLTVVLLAVVGVLVWQFAPWKEAAEKVIPGFGDSLAPTPVPDPNSPPPTPLPPFTECESTDNCCNSLDTICDLRVNEVLFAGTHNSFSSADAGFRFPLGNHLLKIEDQLKAGYRGINLDMCGCAGDLVLCHASCLITRKTNVVFEAMVSFLDANPSETLLVTMELNPDLDQPVDLSVVYADMEATTGFVDYLYVHPDANTEWPTLRELRDSNKRMLVFHYRGPVCTDTDPCPDGLHYWFEHAFETPFQFSTVDAITSDYSESCSVDRGGGGSRKFFGVNHFTSIAFQNRAEDLGTAAMLERRIDECSTLQNQPVSVLSLDFWSKTDLIQVVQDHNKALAQRRAAL